MQVRPAIHALEAAGGTRASAANGVDRFYLPLAVMLTLLAGEPLIGTRRKKSTGAK